MIDNVSGHDHRFGGRLRRELGTTCVRIARVRIKNFRCLEDVEVRFDDVTSLIGPNGVGKSTVLRALDWFFNGSKAADLETEDLTHGAQGDLSVEVEFDHLTADDRAELGKYVTVDSDKCVIWKFRHADGSELMSGNARSFPAFEPVRSADTATQMKERYLEVREAHPELTLPVWKSSKVCEQVLKTWELENPHRLEDSHVAVTNLFGFAGQAVMSGRFDYVFVSADMRASEESRDGRGALIGRILERSVNRKAADEDIKALAASVEARQEEIFERNFTDQLRDLSQALSDAVGRYTAGRTVVVQAHKQEIKPPRTQFGVSILDSKIDTPVEKQGHGFQRTLLVSALQLLAERGSAGQGNGAICLAIEEPELFQHPVQARSFASVLRKLAEDDQQNFQIAYATHSPHFIDAGKFDQVRRITREAQAPEGRAPAVSINSTTIAEVEKRLVGYATSVASQLDAVAATTLSEALFSNGALIVEGTSDKAVLEGLAEKSDVTSLLHPGITIVAADGKSNIPLVHAILSELDIPCYVMFDGDKGAGDRKRRDGKPEADVVAHIRRNADDNRKLLAYLQVDVEDFPETAAHAHHAVLEDTLEPVLTKWSGWSATHSTVVASTGAKGKKNALAHLLTARHVDSPAPQVLQDVLRRVHKLVSR
ncbi:ATP-dependent nuclease [Saccharothrix texasensis]|uniref:Putative ATP-dependent endonuclease of OLD family n=1 Tax=Saccharothrix texasensis TaxID=103734 RepID=A0A3N1H405_9PSEU|nr:ATP-dependent endonuclease [Saccharothrix texasensis]ROP37231.1 putative ATP-dependent endonuclease of OLD family [Saccharothrix texasensis]